MDRFLDTLMNALAVGSLYALIALGYTMVYGILKFINFAHSDVFVLGAWVSYTAALAVGIKDPEHPAAIATWVFTAAYVVSSLGLLLVLYERFLQPHLPVGVRRWVPRVQIGVTTIIVGAWALAVVGLVFLARAVNGQPSLKLLAGGIILIIAMLTCGLVGFTLERMAYKPLRKAPRLNVLITAIGVSLLLQNIGQVPWMFGTKPQGMPTLLPDLVLNETVMQKGTLKASENQDGIRLSEDVTFVKDRSYRLDLTDLSGKDFHVAVTAPDSKMREAAEKLKAELISQGKADEAEKVGKTFDYPAGTDISFNGQLPGLMKGGEGYKLVRAPRVLINLVDVVGACTAILLMILLDWLVFRTKLGRAMRAVSHNPVTASLMGIPVDRVISFTFVLGAMLAAAAGFLYPQKYSGINQTAAPAWVLLGLKAFVAAVIGGIGNIRGAMVGGLFIGLLEFFVRKYISTSMVNVYVFGLLILVLLFKPSGLFGKAVREKV